MATAPDPASWVVRFVSERPDPLQRAVAAFATIML